jgi:hypothetical protein
MAYRYDPNKKPPSWFFRNVDPVTPALLFIIGTAALFIWLSHFQWR